MFDWGGGEGGEILLGERRNQTKPTLPGTKCLKYLQTKLWNWIKWMNPWCSVIFLLMQSKVQRYWYGECPSLLKFCKLHFVPVSSNHWKLPLKVNPNNPKSKKEKLKNIAYPWKGNLPLFFFSGDEMYLISPMLAVNPLTPRSD